MPANPSPARSTLEPTLPRGAYFDEQHYAQECARIFFREWMCVGRAEVLAQPGTYLLAEIAGEQALVVRGRDGTLHAHYNLCRHRGCRLALADAQPTPGTQPQASGTFRGVIVCPYHAWTYELDGALRHAPFLGEDEGLYREEFRLHPIAVDTWGGFIFLNLTPGEHQPLAAQLGGVPERLRRYPLADLRTARRLVYEVAANWKVVVENYNECYHCGPVHPELCRIVPAFKQHGGASLDWEHGVPQAEGTFTFTHSGRTNRAPFPGLTPEEQVRHKGELLYPNLMVSLSADHVAAFTLWPRGPLHTTVVCDFLFHPDAITQADFDPTDAVEFWDLVNRQDWRVCEAVQQGMASRAFTHGYYAPMEDYSLDIRRYIAGKLGK